MTAVATAGDKFVTVGERGHILIFKADGTSVQAAVPSSVTLTDVFFINENKGWVVGQAGIILRTLDGGKTWKKQLDGLEIIAKLKSQATSNDSLRQEIRQWEEDGPDKPLLGIHFVDESRGFAVGAFGLLLATQDAGEHWFPIMERMPNAERRHLYAIRGKGAQLIIAGEQGSLFVSNDAGNHFNRITTPYAGTYFDAAILGGQTILAVGLRGNAFRSEDGGKTWGRVDLGSKYTITRAVVRRDESVVMVDEAGGIWRSQNSDKSFVRETLSGVFPFSGVAEGADGTLLAVGVRGAFKVPVSTPITDTNQAKVKP